MKAQCLSVDRISNLPQNIIETILCLVPIQDAVRTSILSRNWRYSWTKVPKLVFNYKDMFGKSSGDNELSILEKTFEEPPSERKHLSKRCKVFYAIFQVLLLHEGPILDFTLSMNANDTSVEIDQIMRHLLKINALKKLTLHLKYVLRYRVPLSIFSLHHLTDLDLRDCDLGYQSGFHVSGSLVNLYLENVNTHTGTLLYLLSKSPLLKSLTILTSYHNDSDGILIPDYFINYSDSTITELLECLPMIEHLSFSFWVIKCFFEDVIPRELSASLFHLKYFYLEDLCFVDKYGLPFLVLLIRCSPNVQKIKLQIDPGHAKRLLHFERDSVTLEDYPDIWLKHLNELEIKEYSNLKPELGFVKLILARSPVLKKVRISLYEKVPQDEELEMLRVLLQSTRASPVVKIFVQRRAKYMPYRDPDGVM